MKETSVETIIIGAGMAGVLTGYYLQKKGKKVILLEARSVASGQTGRTTAKITSQHGLCYDKLIRNLGRKKAGDYAWANEEAIRRYEELITKEGISCDFTRCPSFLYAMQDQGVELLEKEAKAAGVLGLKVHFAKKEEVAELPFVPKAALCFENQARFDAVRFIRHLAGQLDIREQTKVLSVKGHVVHTDKGDFRAEHIVFATHYPFVNVPGFYFLRQHQERSYVLALEGPQELKGMYYGVEENALSLRSFGNVLLLGGGGHRTGAKGLKEGTEGCCRGYEPLRKMAQIYYPEAVEKDAWSAQDCMPHDGVPFIGKYSLWRPYWYVATGFHKWGMTSSMISAVILSNMICGTKEFGNSNPAVFSPQRCNVKAGIKDFLKDVGESIVGLTGGLFSSKERKCPHMGCRLQWNGEEGSWDCPCHGSRFDRKGQLLDNPAQIDLK